MVNYYSLSMVDEGSSFLWNLAKTLLFISFQSKLSRLPAYLTVQFVRFYFKEKDAINAKILKVK